MKVFFSHDCGEQSSTVYGCTGHAVVSQEYIYPNNRLAKLHREHLLPHILGMPPCMLKGKDAHISLH